MKEFLADEKKKKIATWLLVAVVAMLLFPPWIYTEKGGGGKKQSIRDDAGYSFVASLPSGYERGGAEIDWGRLAIQIAIATCAASIIAISGLSISKKTLKILGATIGGAATVLLVAYWYEYNKNILPLKQIAVSVSYGAEDCTPEHPMLILITNNSLRTVEKVDFKISVKKPGRSTALVPSWLSPEFSSDQIIPPRHTASACYRYPDNQAHLSSTLGKDIKLENLIYEIKDKQVTLQ